jgi:1-acyl-sn-glycerol-3-phosphate acyltransferase
MSLLVSAYSLLLLVSGLAILAALSFLFRPFGAAGRRGFYRLFRFFMRILLACAFIRVKLSGEPAGKISGPAIWAGNHPGLLEPIYLIVARPEQFLLVADTGILKIPFLGRVLTTAGCLTYEPGGPDVAFLLQLREALEQGEHLVVFRPALGDALVRTARLCRAAIIPFLVEQPGARSAYFVNPGLVKITLGKEG